MVEKYADASYLYNSGYTLLRDPQHNKGLSFTEKERDAHYLRGLLPPAVVSQDLQIKKIMHNLRQYQLPLQRYMAMMDLQVIPVIISFTLTKVYLLHCS
jgi:malate dehydrogenase (oxaloacetate-decarboxylating)(NADP+)